jgi:hypothetical protein
MTTYFLSEEPDSDTADADSVQRMDRLRAALVADMRHTTAADAKGNRKMVIGALRVLAPTSPVRAKLARCGKRTPANVHANSAGVRAVACACSGRHAGCSGNGCGQRWKMCRPHGFDG